MIKLTNCSSRREHCVLLNEYIPGSVIHTVQNDKTFTVNIINFLRPHELLFQISTVQFIILKKKSLLSLLEGKNGNYYCRFIFLNTSIFLPILLPYVCFYILIIIPIKIICLLFILYLHEYTKQIIKNT